jgi:TetR/AcrR family transcriptional regulator, ethionamide resistance regulator
VPYIYDDHGRRVAAPTKGARREQSILDGAEAQLDELGLDSMTVESIAAAAGITRAGLYFYFRSRNDVIAALVLRYAGELTTGVATSDSTADFDLGTALHLAVERTADLWRRHASVMRAAVDLSPTVTSIGDTWEAARVSVRQSTTLMAVRAGLPDTPGPDGAAAVVHSLVAMTERSFYEATRDARPIDDAARTVELIWRRALGITGPDA